MKRTRSLSAPKGQKLKRRKAMGPTGDKEVLTNEVATAMMLSSRITRIVPPALRTKLRLSVNVNLDPLSGTVSAWLFRANDGYDPDYTGTGSQPKGLDQFFAFYSKAVCKGSKITIKTANLTSGQGCQWGVSLRNSVTTEVTPRGYVEDPVSVWALGANTNTINQECTLTYNPSKIFGAKGDLKDDEELYFTNASSPSKVAYYHLWLGAWSSFDVAPTQVIGVIEYDYEFFEPRDVGPS